MPRVDETSAARAGRMMSRGAIGLALMGLAACGAQPEDDSQAAHKPSTTKALGDCFGSENGWDGDQDGIDDGYEQCVLEANAPVLMMPFSMDWTRPSSVDWFLSRATLRFHHNNCSDDEIIAHGQVTQHNMLLQRHRKKNGLASWRPCSHNDNWVEMVTEGWDDNHSFFLQLPNDADHEGSHDPNEWLVYGHVYWNNIGGVNAQYWFFYPYNDGRGPGNHEGDWEMVTVRRFGDGNIAGAYMCAHGRCDEFRTYDQVSWEAGTHPIVWVADGSHASYGSEDECDRKEQNTIVDDPNSCETVDGHRWNTWRDGIQRPGLQGPGILNSGEKNRPLNGQEFTMARTLWGERGPQNNGPQGPAYKDGTWLLQ